MDFFTCRSCQNQRPEEDFYKGHRSRKSKDCKFCCSERSKRNYHEKNPTAEYRKKVSPEEQRANNREKNRIRSKKNRLKKRAWLFNYYKKNPCVDCGIGNPLVLQCDHIRDKKMKVSEIVARNMSLDALIKEVAKCQVRCSNCHALKTAKDQGWYKDMAEALNYGSEES